MNLQQGICPYRGRADPGGQLAGIGPMTKDGQRKSGGTALAMSVVRDDQTCAC